MKETDQQEKYSYVVMNVICSHVQNKGCSGDRGGATSLPPPLSITGLCMVTGQIFSDDVTFIILLRYFINGRDYVIFLQGMRFSS